MIMNVALARRIITLGFKSIWRHRLRSLLTILGIVFGVSSVISMLAIGEGASYETQQQIMRLGSRNIIINSVRPPESEQATAAQTTRLSEYGLKYSDAHVLQSTIPNVQVMVPQREIRAQIMYRRRRIDANIVASVPWMPSVTNQNIVRGRFFTHPEVERYSNVCVITSDLAGRIFQFEDPLGKPIRMRGKSFVVVGIIDSPQSTSGSSSGGGGMNVYIPLTTARERFGDIIRNTSGGSMDIEKIELHRLVVEVDELNHVLPAAEVIENVLSRRRREKDYEIIVPLTLLEQAQRTRRIFNIVLGSIAAISLLVGGIGIMNIMLATVTERTREIGIRRALGAKKRDILIQFVAETILLAGIGGILGLVLGISVPFIITYFSGLTTLIQMWTLLLSFGISLIIGLVFGIYPAVRAANMDPIQALRFE